MNSQIHTIVSRLVQRAAPVVFSKAVTEVERSRIYAQRYKAISLRGWGDHSQFPDGKECDRYDSDAIQIQGKFGDSLVASARIVFQRGDQPLPIEINHGISLATSSDSDSRIVC